MTTTGRGDADLPFVREYAALIAELGDTLGGQRGLRDILGHESATGVQVPDTEAGADAYRWLADDLGSQMRGRDGLAAILNEYGAYTGLLSDLGTSIDMQFGMADILNAASPRRLAADLPIVTPVDDSVRQLHNARADHRFQLRSADRNRVVNVAIDTLDHIRTSLDTDVVDAGQTDPDLQNLPSQLDRQHVLLASAAAALADALPSTPRVLNSLQDEPSQGSEVPTVVVQVKTGSETTLHFGAEFRRLRAAAGLSLSDLSRAVHYSRGYLSKVENGGTRPSHELAARCDEALNANGALIRLMPTRAGSPPENTRAKDPRGHRTGQEPRQPDPDQSASFGAELRRLRAAAGLSLSDLSRAVHYSRGYLSKVENGGTRPNHELAARCDEALNANGAVIAMWAAETPGTAAAEATPAAPGDPAGPARAGSATAYGVALRIARQQAGLSIEGLAAVVGVSPDELRAVESGETEPSSAVVARCAALFDGSGALQSQRVEFRSPASSDARKPDVRVDSGYANEWSTSSGEAEDARALEEFGRLMTRMSDELGDLRDALVVANHRMEPRLRAWCLQSVTDLATALARVRDVLSDFRGADLHTVPAPSQMEDLDGVRWSDGNAKCGPTRWPEPVGVLARSYSVPEVEPGVYTVRFGTSITGTQASSRPRE